MRARWSRHSHGKKNDTENCNHVAPAHEEENDNALVILESEIVYSIESFGALAMPVAVNMILSAFVVVFVNTDETIAAGEEIYEIYQVFDVGDDEELSSFSKLGRSLINTLIIVSVLCLMTFVVVLCYKYRFMKCLYAYMVMVTAALLGYFTSNLLMVAISIYPWMNTDLVTFVFLMYNYAAVGTIAIFLPRAIPQWVTQAYLIATSVCLAWQLSYFGSWMTWSLLVMLALYDLFAVLTPCGPLKALANMISEKEAPALPGLLYEATLPSGVTKNSAKSTRRMGSKTKSEEENRSEKNDTVSDEDISGINYGIGDGNPNDSGEVYSTSKALDPQEENVQSVPSRIVEKSAAPCHQQVIEEREGAYIQPSRDEGDEKLQSRRKATQPSVINYPADFSNVGQVPLALAKLYQLSVLDTDGILKGRSIEPQQNRNILVKGGPNSIGSGASTYYTGTEVRSMEFTPQQLSTELTCVFPPRGGRISKARAQDQTYDGGTAYLVYGRTGNLQRKFIVTRQGSVMEVVRRDVSPEDDDKTKGEDDKSTIKLGLGDFIFYSVLVSEAAQYSFTACAACFLVVLWGLAVTLVILAIKGKALPALPISVFLGVIIFLWTKAFLQPWAFDFLSLSIYV